MHNVLKEKDFMEVCLKEKDKCRKHKNGFFYNPAAIML